MDDIVQDENKIQNEMSISNCTNIGNENLGEIAQPDNDIDFIQNIMNKIRSRKECLQTNLEMFENKKLIDDNVNNQLNRNKQNLQLNFLKSDSINEKTDKELQYKLNIFDRKNEDQNEFDNSLENEKIIKIIDNSENKINLNEIINENDNKSNCFIHDNDSDKSLGINNKYSNDNYSLDKNYNGVLKVDKCSLEIHKISKKFQNEIMSLKKQNENSEEDKNIISNIQPVLEPEVKGEINFQEHNSLNESNIIETEAVVDVDNSKLLSSNNNLDYVEKLNLKNKSNTTKSGNVKYNHIVVDEQFLQKIEKTEIQQEKEVQQTMEEIQSIESGLKLDERLMHEKWQIRKNAYKEVSELISLLCERDSAVSERTQLFETFSPWLKYFISDNNLTALVEGLNTFSIFTTYATECRSKALIEFFDELEKIITHNKWQINEICYKIIGICYSNKKLSSLILNELIKKMNSSNLKVLQFIHRIFINLLSQNNDNSLPINYMKMIFEKSILYYSSSLSSKSIERKKIFAKIIQDIYSIIEDDFETIKKFVTMTNRKDIEKVMKGVRKKLEGRKYNFYGFTSKENPNTGNTEINNLENEVNSVSATKSKSLPAKSEVNDLIIVIPEEFYEIPYSTQFNRKKEILEKTNKILHQITSIKEKDKDYREILSNLNYAIDDSNILVHSEGIKCLAHIARLLKMSINQSKLKLLLYSCFDKFKDKKSLVKIELYTLFNILLINFCFTVDIFINFTLNYLITQKNPIIKLSLIEYIKQLFELEEKKIDNDTIILRELTSAIEPNQLLSFSKCLAEIMLKESLSNIKDLCTDLIMIFKQKVKQDKKSEEKFTKITDSLPSYRRNMIMISNSRKESRDNSTNSNSEREYRANLKRIKSNLNFKNDERSRSKDIKYKSNNINASNFDSNKLNINLSMSKKGISKDAKMEIKTNSNNKKHNKDLSNSKNNKNNKSADRKSNNTDKKNKKITNKVDIKLLNGSQPGIKSNTVNTEVNNSSTPPTNIKMVDVKQLEDIEDTAGFTRKILDDTELNETNRTHTTNISVLEKRMESAIEHIYSLNKLELYEYMKKVIKDFLIFVKNVNSKKLQEDLESHFRVIFNILFKIWERIKAFNKNSKRNLIPDELFVQSVKIVIVAPCFVDISSNGNGKVYNKNILPFIEFIREMNGNDEKLYSIYLDIINKFVNIENKGTSFLDGINPRNTFLIFLDYFMYGGEKSKVFDLQKMNVIPSLIQIIDQSPYLSEFEKRQYIDKFESNKSENSLEQEEGYLSDRDRNYVKLESSLIQNIISDREEQIIQNISNVNKSNIYEMTPSEQLQTDDENWKIKLKETENNLHKQIEENEKLKKLLRNTDEEIISFPKIDLQEEKIQNFTNINEDISEIKDKIKQKVRKLDMTIQRLETKIDRHNTVNVPNESKVNSSKQKYQTKIRSPQDFYEEEKGDDSINISNSSISAQNLVNEEDNRNLILKIPTNLLDNKIGEIGLYIKLQSIFQKLNIESKLTFASELAMVLENNSLIKTSSFNCFLQLFEFLLNMLTNQILENNSQSQNQIEFNTILIKLQEIIENLIRKKDLSEIFQILIYLLRKYLPKDFYYAIDKNGLVILKSISYLLKSTIELKIKSNLQIRSHGILNEINELFISYPPSNLREGVPNLEFLDKIYKQLRLLTDISVESNKEQAKMYLENSKKNNNENYCKVYVKYVESIINKF